MNLDMQNAADPMRDDWVEAVAIRATVTSASRVRCAFLPAGEQSNGGAPLASHPGTHATLFIRREEWPAADGPRMGDNLSHAVHGSFSVQNVNQLTATECVLLCSRLSVRR